MTLEIEWICPFCLDEDGWGSIDAMTHHLLNCHIGILKIIEQIWDENAKVVEK